jgi:ribonucleoside-diphosphate reductase alpha chain
MKKTRNTIFKDTFSEEIWNSTYKYHSDSNINQTHYRIAKNLASVEKDPEFWTEQFLDILEDFAFVPGGRINSNAGTGLKGTTYINCFVDGLKSNNGKKELDAIERVSEALTALGKKNQFEKELNTLMQFVKEYSYKGQDSMGGILDALRRQAQILKSEGGYGFCSDVMRPRGAFIEGIGVEGPGSIKFLEIWDKQSEVVTAGSGESKKEKKGKNKIRKGAQMVTQSVWNPAIEEFITAKQTPGRLTKFNMSVLVPDDFMHAVKNNLPWNLEFPVTSHEQYDEEWDGNLRKWKAKGYPVKVYKTYENANILWDLIMESTFSRNEPGILFVDLINRLNNLYYCEEISATNPCGEQLLPKDGGVCLLGSINLTQFINREKNDWDYTKLKTLIPIVVRFMDNVNDITNVPLIVQKENLKNKRRIGIGYMGYASALYVMKVRYGSDKALELTDKLGRFVINESYKASSLIAKEKGSFLLYDQEKYLKSEFLKMALDPETISFIEKNGLRNSHLGSIQPTGNSSIYANNVSGGLEPVFMPDYIRTSIQAHPPIGMNLPIVDWANKRWVYPDNILAATPEADLLNWDWAKEGDENLLLTHFQGNVYKIDQSRGLLKETKVQDYGVRELNSLGEWDKDADWAVDTSKLSLADHVNTMKVFAKYIDSAMSKTINLPSDYPYEDFKNLYMDVYDSGIIKGCTTYRAGTMTSVLAAESTAAKKEQNSAPSEPSADADIPVTTAPKRPTSLPCEIHQLTAAAKKWVVIVGLMGGKPYEVFAFKSERIGIPVAAHKGILTKSKEKKDIGSEYDLEFQDGWVLKDIKSHFETDEQEALTRMVSTSLRHGAKIEFVVSQLMKSEGTVVSFSKAIARTLKKYWDENAGVKMKCAECNSENVAMQEGCFVCKSCGSSRCS